MKQKFFKALALTCAILLTSCNSGSNSSGDQTPTIVKHAYIVNSSANSYAQCGVSSAGIEAKTCVTIKPSGNGSLDYPAGIAFNGNYAYFINSNSYTQCLTNESGVILSSTCNTASLLFLNIESIYSIGIAFKGNYAYITNSSINGSYIQCNVDDNGIESDTCVNNYIIKNSESILNYPNGISFSGNYAYFTSNIGDYKHSYTQCVINNGIIESETCSRITPKNGDINLLNGAGFMAFNNNYAYFPNYNTNSYTQCNVNNGLIESNLCSNTTPYRSGSAFYGVEAVTFDNDFAYFTNYKNNSYAQCNVSSSGINFSSCRTVILNGVLYAPMGIAFN